MEQSCDELFLSSKLFVGTKIQISKNTFKCGIESNIAFKKVSGDVSQYFYGLEGYGTH